VALSVAMGALAVAQTWRERSVTVPIPGDGLLLPTGSAALRPGVVLDAGAEIVVVVEHADAGQLILAALTRLPGYALITAVLVLLWRQVARVRRSGPFASRTSGRLMALGWLLTVGGPVSWAVEFVARFLLSDTVLTVGARASIDLTAPVTWGLAGLGLLAIAQIVRSGENLRDELDTVI
jgi:hypothetical protein